MVTSDKATGTAEKTPANTVTIQKEEYERLVRKEEAAQFWEKVYKRLDELKDPTPLNRASILGSEIMNVPSSELDKLLGMIDKEHDKVIAEIKERVKETHETYMSSMENAERVLRGGSGRHGGNTS